LLLRYFVIAIFVVIITCHVYLRDRTLGLDYLWAHDFHLFF